MGLFEFKDDHMSISISIVRVRNRGLHARGTKNFCFRSLPTSSRLVHRQDTAMMAICVQRCTLHVGLVQSEWFLTAGCCATTRIFQKWASC